MPNKESYAIEAGKLQRANGEPIQGTNIGALVSVLEITEFLAAVNGKLGDLDAWLEVHDEKACRAIFKAAFSPISDAKVQGAAPTDLLKDLHAIDRAMQHMGDVLNGMDAVEAEDEVATADGFSAIARLLATAQAEPHALSVLRQISRPGSIGDDPEADK